MPPVIAGSTLRTRSTCGPNCLFPAGPEARGRIAAEAGVEVDDEAAPRLMLGMLRAISHNPKLSHAEALRQSMLAAIEGARSDYEANPAFWAPFVVVGEPAKPR